MDKIIQFFKPADPKQVAKKWQSNIRSEQRRLDSQINDIKRELSKTTREIKQCLKRSDVNSARVLAMQVCKARKTIENLYETKANYNSISMRLGESVGRLTQVGSLGKSSEILKVRAMRSFPERLCCCFVTFFFSLFVLFILFLVFLSLSLSFARARSDRFLLLLLLSARARRANERTNKQSMNAIANVGRASKDVVAMSKEMFKMGVIEDVLEDTLGMNALSAEEEDETDKEVDAILKEIAGEVTGAMPERVVVKAAEEAPKPKKEEQKEHEPIGAAAVPAAGESDDMQSRLDALRE